MAGVRAGWLSRWRTGRSDLPKFDLNLLASLDALLRAKNVTAAAEEIGVSQPAMSGMLKRLREHLRDPILVRVGSQYELSTRAQELNEAVRQALLTIEDLTRPAAFFKLSQSTRHFRIMASEFTQFLILPPLFRRAAEEAPKLTFEILPIVDPFSRVHMGDIDLAITAAPLASLPEPIAGLLRVQTILEESFVALVDADHPLGDSATLEEIGQYPHIETVFPDLNCSVEETIISTEIKHDPPPLRVASSPFCRCSWAPTGCAFSRRHWSIW